jgi:hypothetical protein
MPFNDLFGGSQQPPSPQGGTGTWEQIFQLLPLLLGAAQSGKSGFGPFMEGWQKADEQMKGHQQGQQRLQMEQQRIVGEQQDRAFREKQLAAAAAHAEAERVRNEDAKRQQHLASIEGQVVSGLPQLTNKEEYDPFISSHETLAGVPANTFRTKYPFTAPGVQKRAAKTWDTLQKGPFKDQIQPGMLVEFDRDGDGTPERIPVEELAQLAQVPALLNDEGKMQWPSKDLGDQGKANAEGYFSDLLAQAKAEGKDTTDPKVRAEIRDSANTRFKEKSQSPDDPILNEMRQMRIELMRRQANTPDLSPAQFNMANRLSDDFARDSKDFVQRGQSYGTVLAAAQDPSAAGDLSLIFAYMKMLDPGSVVREGEFATAQNSAGIPDRIRNVYNKAISGERLAPNQRLDFVKQARAIYGASKQRQDQLVKTFTTRALRAKVPVELVVIDYGAGVEPESAAPNGPKADPLGIR